MAFPVIRVAVEPKNLEDQKKLEKGLKILNQVDSSVQIIIQESGEHVLCVLGEIHLEKCLRDLKENYANIDFNVSKPMVQFRETILIDKTLKHLDLLDESKTVTIKGRNNFFNIKMIALPLPSNVIESLEKNKDQLKDFIEKPDKYSCNNSLRRDLVSVKNTVLGEMRSSLFKIVAEDEFWSLGPKKLSTCILVNKSQFKHLKFWSSEVADRDEKFNRAIINGFQAAIEAGPLFNESMHGVCFVILELNITEETSKIEHLGNIITIVKEACLMSFQKQEQRLVSPMYSLNIIVNTNVLGE